MRYQFCKALLADENFPRAAVEALVEHGHNVVWARTEFPGIADTDVLRRAQSESRILLTFDQDFGELAFRVKLLATNGIILFQITAPSSAVMAQKVVSAVTLRDDWVGQLSVVEDDKIRMRPL